MSIQSLESALRDAAADLPPDAEDVYEHVMGKARVRRRRRRLAMTLPALAAVFALVFAYSAVRGTGRDHVKVTAPARAAPWRPPTRVEGDHLVVPLRFLTGGSVDVVLPVSVDPATITSFEPGGSVAVDGQPDLARDVTVQRGTVADLYGAQQLLRTYQDASGRPVGLYRGTANDVNFLVFQIGDWVVGVWDYPQGDERGAAMTDAQRELWATHLRGYQTADGFLVLDPIAPLTQDRTTDGPDASLQFGTNDLAVLLRACQPNESAGPRDSRGFVSHSYPDSGTWICDPQVPLIVSIGGTPQWQAEVAPTFELEHLTGPLPAHW